MRELIKKSPHILSFGILQVFFSSPGQTFLISLFVLPIFNELSISQSMFAGIYSAATLSAALLLNPAGRCIDKFNIKTVVKTISVLMALGCLVIAFSTNIAMLFIGFFMLRFIGQGVFSLTASTLMIKQFEKNRGKAMGVMTLGFPLSEAIYPSVALLLLGLVGWRMGFVIFAASNILLMLPIQLYLLNRSNIREGHFQPGETDVNPQHLRGQPEERKVRAHKDLDVKDIIRDFKFYLILIASCVPPMVATGLLFYQEILFNTHGWTLSLAAVGLFVYAICKAFGSVWIGGVVDRHGPFVPFVILILMLALAAWLASLGGHISIIFIYFSLMGAALGFSSPVTNVIWPYFYGVKHMGSIKGFVATFRNGITAFGPLPIAMMMDAGVSITSVLKWMSFGVFFLAVLPLWVRNLDRKS